MELWDKFKEACNVVSESTDELDSFYKNFLKERSKIESNYSKQLKKLVKSYQPKTPKKNRNDEESTRTAAFREILQQLNFQANQHELISETIEKECIKQIQQKAKENRSNLTEYKKEAKILETTLDKSYKALDEAKVKYQKSHNEKEHAKAQYDRADADGSYSRNDVMNFQQMHVMKVRENDDSKSNYANQLVKTNKMQEVGSCKLCKKILSY